MVAGLAGCQLILGFEDHTLGAGGAGGGTTTSTGGQTSAGGGGGSTTTTGGGGQGGTGGTGTGGAPPVVFGTPTPVVTGTGAALNEVAADATGIYVLDRAGGQILRFQDDGTTETIADTLDQPRGIALDANGVYTTSGSTNCDVLAFPKVPNAIKLTLFSITGSTCRAVAVGGGQVLVSAANAVYRGSSTAAGASTKIGLQIVGPIPAVARGTEYYWIDPSGDALRTSGALAQGQAPGNQVKFVSSGLAGPIDIAERNGTLYIATSQQIGKVSATVGSPTALTDLTIDVTSPTGLSVDGTHAYFVDTGNKVKAIEIGGGTNETLWTAPSAPFDTASRGDAIFVTTSDGTLEKIEKM
jgi:hypothetical protein